MSDGNSLINFGDISKPAVVLIEKISDAIGGLSKPSQIRRIARAEADAERIKAINQLEISELQRRALNRFLLEEAKKQDNIESIAAKALPCLREDADPKSVEDDWITNFFDKCRLISDKQMQSLWAKLLAGEANSPGSYSKRTIDILGSLDKTDALLFSTLCRFSWFLDQVFPFPLVYNEQDSIYTDHGISFDALEHLDSIGLINFSLIGVYERTGLPKHYPAFYYEAAINIEFPAGENNQLELGHVSLTKAGQELSLICASEPIPGFLEYILSRWKDDQLIVSCPYPLNSPVTRNVQIETAQHMDN